VQLKFGEPAFVPCNVQRGTASYADTRQAAAQPLTWKGK
jgi:hypothetical protein